MSAAQSTLVCLAFALLLAACSSGAGSPDLAPVPDLGPIGCALGGNDCPAGLDCSAAVADSSGVYHPACRAVGDAGVGESCDPPDCRVGLLCSNPVGVSARCRIVCDSVAHKCPVGPCNGVGGTSAMYVGFCL